MSHTLVIGGRAAAWPPPLLGGEGAGLAVLGVVEVAEEVVWEGVALLDDEAGEAA